VRREPTHASADYDAVSEATVEKHCLERYLALEFPSRSPAERKEIFDSKTDADRRVLCTLWQPVYRSARVSSQSSTPCCGMDSSTCRATRCCGDCGLSIVGYSHEHCRQCYDLMKCQRCEQIKERGFGMKFEETKACFENLKARRVHNGRCLRTPSTIVTAGYDQGAARG
jgi:hypothetical protein